MSESFMILEESMASASGRILLRMESSLHQRLLVRAKDKQQSLNDLCLERLLIPTVLEGTKNHNLRNIVAAADQLLKHSLLGVVFYGSQARGEGRSDSDWDVLVVAAEQVSLSREIYQRWDSSTSQENLREFEVHFAHLPSKTSVATGFWSEIALDGIILFDQDFCVSRYLARVRREIAEGKIIRKTKHGQSYWVHKELTLDAK